MNARGEDFNLILDIPVQVSVELGRKTVPIGEVVQLGPGSVVELGKAAGESLDLFVNGRLVAKGEAVVVGEKYGIRIVEVVGAPELVQAANEAPAADAEDTHAA